MAGTAALGASVCLSASASAGSTALEIRRIRLVHAPAMCLAPQYLCEAFLRNEGFDEVEFVPATAGRAQYSPIWVPNMLAEGLADLSMGAAPGIVDVISRNGPVTVIGGIHAGCYELFAHGAVRRLADLKHRSIAVSEYTDGRLFVSSMLAYVGIDPNRDVHWARTKTDDEAMALFETGRADAFLGFPPQPQQLRARGVGHLVLSTVSDRPWSQYFCCLLAAHRPFLSRYPNAAKRALRAVLMAADLCASQPERAARYMIEQGHVQDYKYALGLVTDLPYRRWREAEPEDTLRFHALRLHEVGLIDATPRKIIADGTDWRFLHELKREMKA